MDGTITRIAVAGFAVVTLLAACDGGDAPDGAATVALTAIPLTPSPEPPTAAPTATDTASPSPTAEEPRDPTDNDRARFIAGYRPSGVSDLRNVSVDTDADGQQEIVFAFVVDSENRSQVDLANWLGTSYEITAAEAGGNAEDLDDLLVRDLNGDDVIDIALTQSIGASGRSASLWTSAGDGSLAPLTAEGDCFDGSHTYGDTGVELEDRDADPALEISAVCEEPDVPQPLWPTVVYDWDGDAYVCAYRETVEGGREPCRGGTTDAG